MENTAPKLIASNIRLTLVEDFAMTGDLYQVTYLDGSDGLMLSNAEESEVISVNLSAYGMTPERGAVFIPTYNHPKLPEDLVAQGLGRIIREVPIGYGHGHEIAIEGLHQ